MSELEQTKDQLLSYIHRSQYALYWLAAEPEVQVGYLDEFSFGVDELLEQFHDYYNPEFTGVALLLTPEQGAALASVFSLFPWNQQELLEIQALNGPEWSETRKSSRNALEAFGFRWSSAVLDEMIATWPNPDSIVQVLRFEAGEEREH